MEKTNEGKQENKPTGLKNSRYWENVIPQKEGHDSKKLPDCRNGELQKALH